ncbi:nucleotide sugar dehydrogenase [Bacillus sp. Brlt_9]|uniref:nucleotide sugar dehydrogenase n=1 Tax=Bacillus sp. Brlt_9 TaxID=3110916 RepID=UPI003F7B5FD9
MKEISVIGLGFVGLPLSLSFSMNNTRVYGVDVNQNLVKEINQGLTHHKEGFDDLSIQEILKTEIRNERYSAHSNLLDLPESVSTYIITVGIPVKDSVLDTRAIDSVANDLSKRLKKGDLVILRSTVVPGFTNEYFKPILERSGLKAGEDFYLAYASERIAEGKAFKEFIEMPLVIGGVNKQSAQKAEEVLTIVTKADTFIASSIEIVEMSKVIENAQRDVNIAMVQQYATMARKMGIDSHELIQMANTHKRVNLLTPGPGVGGYCLPNAFHYLVPKAKELGILDDLSITREARFYNDQIPTRIVETIEQKLTEKGKALSEAKIAVFGLAMKDFSNDDRISPPVFVTELFHKKAKETKAFDPAVPTVYPFKENDAYEAVKDADVLIVLCVQEEMKHLDFKKLRNSMKEDAFIFDTKHFFKKNHIEDIEINYF